MNNVGANVDRTLIPGLPTGQQMTVKEPASWTADLGHRLENVPIGELQRILDDAVRGLLVNGIAPSTQDAFDRCVSYVAEVQSVKEVKEDGQDVLSTLLSHAGFSTVTLQEPNDKKAVVLAAALKNNSVIRHLSVVGSLNVDGMNFSIKEKGCKALGEMLQVNTTLETLVLDEHILRQDCIVQLASGLQHHTMLRGLSLAGNGISDEGVNVLVQSLAGHDNLSKLNLAFNDITDEGATTLAETCERKWPVLKELGLGGNECEEAGLAAVCKVVSKKSLETLTLNHSDLNGDNIAGVAKLLKDSTALKTLNLSDCRLYDTEASTLAKALQANTSLTSLDLSNNYVGLKGKGALLELMLSNKSLTSLWVQRSPSMRPYAEEELAQHAEADAEIDQYLERNRRLDAAHQAYLRGGTVGLMQSAYKHAIHGRPAVNEILAIPKDVAHLVHEYVIDTKLSDAANTPYVTQQTLASARKTLAEHQTGTGKDPK